MKHAQLCSRDDFIKTYDRVPTETQLKAYVKMMNLIKSERQRTGISPSSAGGVVGDYGGSAAEPESVSKGAEENS